MIGKLFKRKSTARTVANGFKKNLAKIAELKLSKKRNEEEVRRWCLHILTNAFGYNEADIETESKVLGQRVDIAIKYNNKVFLVIECKAATIALNKAATNQAAVYAIGLGAEWAVVTNGHTWKMYHVSPTKGIEPDVVEIFDVSLLDDDGVSNDDATDLFLMTPESIFSGETAKIFHHINAVSETRLSFAFNSPSVVNAIKRELEDNYRRTMGVNVIIDDELISEFLGSAFESEVKEYKMRHELN